MSRSWRAVGQMRATARMRATAHRDMNVCWACPATKPAKQEVHRHVPMVPNDALHTDNPRDRPAEGASSTSGGAKHAHCSHLRHVPRLRPRRCTCPARALGPAAARTSRLALGPAPALGSELMSWLPRCCCCGRWALSVSSRFIKCTNAESIVHPSLCWSGWASWSAPRAAGLEAAPAAPHTQSAGGRRL